MAQVNDAIAFLADTEAEIEEAKQKAAGLNRNGAAATTAKAASPEPAAAKTSEAIATVAQTAQATVQATVQDTAAAPTRSASNSGRVVVSPRARKLAKELKVDLNGLQGSGPHGRIVAQDVESAAGRASAPAQSMSAAPAAASAAVPVVPGASRASAVPAPASAAPGELVAFNTLQQAVVRNMDASLSVPVFRVGYTITTNELDKLYSQIKPKGVTMTALLAKAVAVTLKKASGCECELCAYGHSVQQQY